MSVVVNARDVMLQAASPRVVPLPIPIDRVEGLEDALDSLDGRITGLGVEINSLLNTTQDLVIYTTATTLVGSGVTTPTTATLTAVRKNGLTGSVAWSVTAGSATLTPSGDSCSVTGSSISGNSVTVRARIVKGTTNYDAFVTLTRLGTLAGTDKINLATQVTGQLANSSVSGLGALALLNAVNLSTQTVGALNGQTQVTNLGTLAYANAVAANQIGAGTLAAGVVYAGEVNADNITSGTLTGRTVQTASSGARVVLKTSGSDVNSLIFYDQNGAIKTRLTSNRNSPSTITIAGLGSNDAAVRLENTGVGWGCRVEGRHGIRVNSYDSAGWGVYCESQGIGAYFSGQQYAAVFNTMVRITERNNMPPAVPGGIAYHNTHKFIFSDGVKWYKPQWVEI